jgi:HD-like signal output (HDOD) protein
MEFVTDAARGQLSMPAIPRVVRRLVTQLKDPSASLSRIVTELEQDPLLTARTLQLANSPFYSGRRTLSSVTDAVAVLGVDALQRVVMTVGLAAVFIEVPGVDMRQFWLDASVAAAAARQISMMSEMTREASEAAYLAGLLHASGHLILCLAFPEDAVRAFESPRSHRSNRILRGADLAAVELEAFGMVYPAVGAAWVEKMGFPQAVEHAIAHHLDPHGTSAGALASVIHLATQVAASVGIGDSVEEAFGKIDVALMASATVEPEALEKGLHSSYRDLLTLPGPL